MTLKKYISLFLIALILSHGIFQFLVFKVFELKYKSEIKTMIKQGFPEENMIKFVFKKDIEEKSLPNFKWIKKNEFRFKGEMYDIVSKEIIGDSIYFKCIHDVKESGLFANLEKYIDSYLNKNPEKNNEFFLLDNSLSKFYSSGQKKDIINRYFSIEKNLSIKVLPLLKGEHLIVLPPPKLFLS